MMQTEQSRMTMEDRRELEIRIKELEQQVEEITDKNLPGRMKAAKELRRLRRMR